MIKCIKFNTGIT